MLVIIHGWSDNYSSFKELARQLSSAGPTGVGETIEDIHLGDYISLNDHVTFNDLTEAMEKAWTDRGLPREPRSVDAVVHSTGGLVIRDWLVKYCKPETAPIKRLLMLAPANFGSPLAHTGRSVIGRAVKGWGGTKLFETGTQILKGLELASPYSWNLAERDLFGEEKAFYGPGRILCTVLVGNTGYSGISAIANKPGSDGTVRVSTANLNAAKYTLNFCGETLPQDVSKLSPVESQGFAFGVMDGEDHGTIAAKGRGHKNQSTGLYIRDALKVEDGEFQAWQDSLRQETEGVMASRRAKGNDYFAGYQNTVVRLVDNYGMGVSDYVFELYANEDKTARDKKLTQAIQEAVVNNVHVYADDPSYRSLLINCDKLYELFDKTTDRLNISVTAYPEMKKDMVGYRTYTDRDIGYLSLSIEQIRTIFKPNRTLFVRVEIPRLQSDEVFRFKAVP